jgi:hypothetical protein
VENTNARASVLLIRGVFFLFGCNMTQVGFFYIGPNPGISEEGFLLFVRNMTQVAKKEGNSNI